MSVDDQRNFSNLSPHRVWFADDPGHSFTQPKPFARAEVLKRVESIICRDRNAQHGEPENVFGTIAGMWEEYLRGRKLMPDDAPGLMEHDVAAMMVLFKIARHANNPAHTDNGVDATGYSAIMCELAYR